MKFFVAKYIRQFLCILLVAVFAVKLGAGAVQGIAKMKTKNTLTVQKTPSEDSSSTDEENNNESKENESKEGNEPAPKLKNIISEYEPPLYEHSLAYSQQLKATGTEYLHSRIFKPLMPVATPPPDFL